MMRVSTLRGRASRSPQHPFKSGVLLCAALALTMGLCGASNTGAWPAAAITRMAAESCGAKVKALESHAARPSQNHQTIRFTEDEINSYLAFELSSRYHPSLKSLVVSLEEAKLHGTAVIDFDQLRTNSSKALARLLAAMFSGVHQITVRGNLIADGGKAKFQVDEALFDSNTLPKFVVEEIITAVGRKQNPPFDPMKPTPMPYRIARAEVHAGYVVVSQ